MCFSCQDCPNCLVPPLWWHARAAGKADNAATRDRCACTQPGSACKTSWMTDIYGTTLRIPTWISWAWNWGPNTCAHGSTTGWMISSWQSAHSQSYVADMDDWKSLTCLSTQHPTHEWTWHIQLSPNSFVFCLFTDGHSWSMVVCDTVQGWYCQYCCPLLHFIRSYIHMFSISSCTQNPRNVWPPTLHLSLESLCFPAFRALWSSGWLC